RRYRRLLVYAAPYRGGWVLIALFTLAYTVVAVLQPWPMQILIDQVLGQQSRPGFLEHVPGAGTSRGLIAWVVAATLVLFALAVAVEVALTHASIRVSPRLTSTLPNNLLPRTHPRP